ncbi:hypothetical protein RSAG8_12379, partial [Rhizoctonia solani AG-8 WAC10335]
MRKGLDYQTFEFCRNPRCPDPALAKYTCPGEMGDTFCSVNCLAFLRRNYFRVYQIDCGPNRRQWWAFCPQR